MKKLLLLTLALSIYSTTTHAQTMNNVGIAYPGTPAPLNGVNSQLQTAQDNQLLFQGNNVFGSNAARNNIKVGIGVFSAPINGVVERLHLNDITAARVGTKYTNLTTGPLVGDGFFTGINAAGHAMLVQEEALPMRFFTTSLERMRIQPNGFVGVNITAPGNRFELNSGIINTSGFRFTQLTSISPTVANPGPGVLAVSAAGDIIYVPGGGSISGGNNGVSVTGGNVQLGNLCGGTTATLLSSREIPMAGFNLEHTMPANSLSQFNIGFPACITTNPSRFSVNNDHYTTASLFNTLFASAAGIQAGTFRTQNTGAGNAVGLSSAALASNASADAIAVNARSAGGTGFTSFDNIGLNANTANATHASLSVNADINGSSSPINQGHNTEILGGTNAAAQNTGASLTVATPGNTNFGVTAIVSGAASNIGVYASVPTSSGGTGPGLPPGPDYAGFFNGDVFISNMYGISDKRLKKDITKLENSLDIIKKLSPVSYTFDQAGHMNLNLAKGKQYGFISQEVQQILPELTAPVVYPSLVGTDGKQVSTKEEYLGLNYQGFTAIMVDAIKQQQAVIENQQKQIDELKELVKAQTGMNTSSDGAAATGTNRQSVELSDKDVVVLNQNTPNPFAQQTVITYNIPATSGIAQLHFFDGNGTLIKVVDLKEKGHGQITVFAGDLTNGMYTYTMVIDGKTSGTKKMIKSE